MKRVENDQVPRFMGAKKMSLHQTGFQEVIAAAEFTGQCPEEMLLIGIQPVELEDYGGSLRPQIKAKVPEALAIAVERLRQWGIEVTPRPADARLEASDDVLGMGRYEAERPSAEAACRIGDDRFLRIREDAEPETKGDA